MDDDLLAAVTKLADLRNELISLYEEVFVGADVAERDALLAERAVAIKGLQDAIVAQGWQVGRLKYGSS